MKRSYKLLIPLAVLMYLSQIMWSFFLIFFKYNIGGNVTLYTFSGLGIGFGAVALVFCFIVLGSAILSFFNHSASPLKMTMIIKLVLIPFYLINFFYWFLLVSGFANHWLYIAIPLVITLAVVVTFAYMLATSLFAISYLLNLEKEKKIQLKGSVLVGFIFLFFFCLDAIGSVMLFTKVEEKDGVQESPLLDK